MNMLKITPYLGILVIFISIAGLWYPKLGYFVPIIFLTLMIISPFKGRWFCGNLCPRGSFNDFWLGKITLNKKIPKFFGRIWLRIIIFILLFSFIITRLIFTKGLINKIGMVFIIMCIITTSIAILFGIFISPRAWCTFCPMGSIQRLFGKNKYQLKFNKKRCNKCGLCNSICPMQLKVNEISNKPDCIKCGRCIDICPKKALKF